MHTNNPNQSINLRTGQYGVKNLVVGGCSFTSSKYAYSWPLVLRDQLGSDCVYNFSLLGAGNYHIASSLIWNLETLNISPQDTLIVIMWSGNDRDDCIVDNKTLLTEYSDRFDFSTTVSSGLSGGEFDRATSNVSPPLDVRKLKSHDSRAIENYIYIVSTWHYLKSKGYQFVFTEFTDRQTPSCSSDFDIKPHLPEQCQNELAHVMAEGLQDIYTWSLERDELADDDFHPAKGHVTWTTQVLVPWLQRNKIIPFAIR